MKSAFILGNKITSLIFSKIYYYENQRSVEWARITESLPRPLSLLNSSNSWEVLCSALLFRPGKKLTLEVTASPWLHLQPRCWTRTIIFFICPWDSWFWKCIFPLLWLFRYTLTAKALWERNFIKMFNGSGRGPFQRLVVYVVWGSIFSSPAKISKDALLIL